MKRRVGRASKRIALVEWDRDAGCGPRVRGPGAVDGGGGPVSIHVGAPSKRVSGRVRAWGSTPERSR